MKNKRFTEEQVIRILHEAKGGVSVADVCRKHNCSEQSFCKRCVTGTLLGWYWIGNAPLTQGVSEATL